jgi:hypothetical protein
MRALLGKTVLVALVGVAGVLWCVALTRRARPVRVVAPDPEWWGELEPDYWGPPAPLDVSST